MKFCIYCANPDEYEEYAKKCIMEHRKIVRTGILSKDNALKINSIPFADICVTIDCGNELAIHVTDSNEKFNILHYSSKKIKYCPMCGRKLQPYKY